MGYQLPTGCCLIIRQCGETLFRGGKHFLLMRILIPFMLIQRSAATLGPQSAPLLEKERYALLQTLVTDFTHPVGMHRPSAWSALTPDDHPVDIGKVESAKRTEQRFKR